MAIFRATFFCFFSFCLSEAFQVDQRYFSPRYSPRYFDFGLDDPEAELELSSSRETEGRQIMPEPCERRPTLIHRRIRFLTKNNINENFYDIIPNEIGIDFGAIESFPVVPAGTTKVVFLIHGLLNNAETGALRGSFDQYLLRGDTYPVAVDWRDGACHQCGIILPLIYWTSVLNVHYVGVRVAEFINAWIGSGELKWDLIHIVGHSLGAHVAGRVGQTLKEKYGIALQRITGLDVAAPCFENDEAVCLGMRRCPGLTAVDAEMVDVVHTSGRFLGYTRAIGSIDFYPNGGKVQPGCIPIIVGDIKTDPCSHSRATALFAESINPRPLPGQAISTLKFRALKCETYQDFIMGQCGDAETTVMGEYADLHKLRGIFYLATRDSPPYSLYFE